MRHPTLLLVLLSILAVSGCHGTLALFGVDDDSTAGDDDDSTVGDDDDSTVGDDDDSTVGDDDDSTVGDDDDSTVGDDDDEPDHVDCGPWVVPQGPGGEVRVFSGDVFLQQTSAGWVWQGCEVERYFESSGAFDCENYWLVTGSMVGWDAGAEAADYALEFEYQSGPTSCGGEGDDEWRYLVDYDFGAGELDLYWANPGGGNWSLWASTLFSINAAQTEVTFDYVTEFLGAR